MKNIILFVLLFLPFMVFPQVFTVKGKVFDQEGIPLPSCHIHYKNNCIISDNNGKFELKCSSNSRVDLQFTYVGFLTYDTVFQLNNDVEIFVYLHFAATNLKEVAITSLKNDTFRTMAILEIDKNKIFENQSSNALSTLQKLPGFHIAEVGGNIVKPVIRGFGFNRVCVIENGIKQEGQQWGADHGLELDPFSADKVELVKGVSALEYGSDAIGGILEFKSNTVPIIEGVHSEFSSLAKSLNQLLGGSVLSEYRKNKFFVKVRYSYLDYGDMKINTDTINFMERKIPIYNNMVKNTAGNEQDFSTHFGYIGKNNLLTASFSIVKQKIGYFPGAHGLPDPTRLLDDGNRRNVDFPFQLVQHSKLILNYSSIIGKNTIKTDLSWQQNHRQEWSMFHTHYSNQSAPLENPDLELDFNLNTITLQSKIEFILAKNAKVEAGFQEVVQKNSVAGYNYFLPEFVSSQTGIFARIERALKHSFKINAGIRIEYTNMKIKGFEDNILYNYLILSGYNNSVAKQNSIRSYSSENGFPNFGFNLGLRKDINRHHNVNLNFGRGYRNPTAVELAANGVHHGAFRHEKGNPNLTSEKSWYFDLLAETNYPMHKVSFNPFVYYFSNFIFLNPSGEWSVLPDAGQIYEYQQSAALMTGFDASYLFEISKNIKSFISVEYIYNQQLNKESTQRYPLPFSPPANIFAELKYSANNNILHFSKMQFSVNCNAVSAQNRIARNEDKTAAYLLAGLAVSGDYVLAKQKIQMVFQISNLFNTTYYNHLSYYRKLNMPESGRNYQLLIRFPLDFYSKRNIQT